jgi:hypothetical protein
MHRNGGRHWKGRIDPLFHAFPPFPCILLTLL